MQPIIKENVSVASVGKNIASSRLGHREFESRNVKGFTRISRQNKRYTNMDLAIPTCSMPSSKCTSNSPFSRFLSCSSLQLVQIAIKSKQQQKTIRIAAQSLRSATPIYLPPRHFTGNEQCKKITILFAMPTVFFVLIFILT